MLHVEQQRTIQYFQYLSDQATAAAANYKAEYQQLLDVVTQQTASLGDKTAAAGSVAVQLQQLSRVHAQQLMQEEWAGRFSTWCEQAKVAFEC